VSGYARQALDDRPALSGYTTVDVTASFSNLWSPGLDLRVGAKNLLDADVSFPSPDGYYEEGYPRPGRTWWAQIGYRYQ